MKTKSKKSFGAYLVEEELITQQQLDDALKVQNKNRILSNIALEFQYLTNQQVEEIEQKAKETASSFEEIALSENYLSPNILKYLFDIRLRRKVRIGKLLVDSGAIHEDVLYEALMAFEVNRKRLNKILICEPSRLIASCIQKTFDKYHYQSFLPQSIEEAIQIAKKEKPELLITNYDLWDGARGDELCRDIVSQSETADIHTIVMAQESNYVNIDLLFDYGVHYILHLPFNEFELLNIIYSVEETKTVRQKETILIIDDSPIIRSMIAKELGNKYRLLMAQDGSEGVFLAEEKVPDLILMDVQMPKMDGFTATKLIRENPKTAGIPTIIISSLSDAKDRAKGFEVGASEYFTKPFKRGQLYNFITVLFEAKKSHKTEKALVVDDNPMICHIIQYMLSKHNILPITAGNGVEAMEQLKREKFDIIISDITMPLMDGFEFCSLVKRNDEMKHIPFIMISAMQDKDNILKALSLGANDFITKPFDEDELMARITSHVAYKRLYDDLYELLKKNEEAEGKIRHQKNLLDAVARSMQILLSSYELPDAFNAVLALLGKATKVDRCCICERKKDLSSGLEYFVRTNEWQSKSKFSLLNTTFLSNTGEEAVVFEHWDKTLSFNKPIYGTKRDFKEEGQAFLKKHGICSIQIMPIFIGDILWGFIGFEDCKEERVWTREEEAILMSASTGVSGALEKNEFTDIISLELNLDKNLREITMSLMHVTDINWFNDAVNSILKNLADIFGMDAAYLFKFSPTGLTVTHAFSKHGEKNPVAYYEDLDNKTFVNSFPLFIIDTYQVGDINEMEEELSFFKSAYQKAGVSSLLHVASLKKDNEILAIGLHSREKKPAFSDAYLNFLLETVTLIGLNEEKTLLMSELVDKNKKLEELSIKDGLTDLYNHRCFQETLTLEMKKAERSNSSLSLLLIDIDFFKKVNDIHGHPAGDEVLKSISAILKDTDRDTDFPSRYGGEEFALILINTDKEGALISGERVRKNVESATIEAFGKSIPVTISIGAATLSSGMEKSTLIQNADTALYQAKESGRNTIRFHDSKD